ncbi:MAG: hypothetical protein ACUVQX_07025 [Candidatus Bathycorpusculaceae bacterium]
MDLTEYGEIMINAYMDEWGFRKIDGLLEDGKCIIIIAVGGVTYEIYVNAACQTLSTPAYETIYTISKDAAVNSQGLTASETTFNISKDAITQALADFIIEIVTGGQLYEIFIDAITKTQATLDKVEATFNIPLSAILNTSALATLKSTFNISPEASVKVQAEAAIVKEGEIKITRLFLILGNLAIQIQGF